MTTQKVTDAIAQFPATFGLRAFPGDVFKISPFHSYESDFPAPGTVYLYTYVRRGDAWHSFAKGTPQELRAEVVAL
jgi:hypothetical protein